MARAARALLVLLALLLTSSACAAIALASFTGSSHQLHKRRTLACKCAKHHRCSRSRTHVKGRRGHPQCHEPKPKAKHGVSTSSPTSSPAAAAPTTGTSGSTPSSGGVPTTSGGTTTPGEDPSAPVAPTHVEVTAEDTGAFRFVLSRPTVPAGKVIIEFINHGQDEHNLNAAEPGEDAVAGSIPNTVPGAHPSLSLTMRPGSYTLFCSIADHEAKGMKATLVVE